jgi:hypothetical protein
MTYRILKPEELHHGRHCEILYKGGWQTCVIKLEAHHYCGFILYAALPTSQKKDPIKVTIRTLKDLRIPND